MICQWIGREEKERINGVWISTCNSLRQTLRRVGNQQILVFTRSVESRLRFPLTTQAAAYADVSYEGIETMNCHSGMEIVGPINWAALANDDCGFKHAEIPGDFENTFYRNSGGCRDSQETIFPQDQILKPQMLLT